MGDGYVLPREEMSRWLLDLQNSINKDLGHPQVSQTDVARFACKGVDTTLTNLFATLKSSAECAWSLPVFTDLMHISVCRKRTRCSLEEFCPEIAHSDIVSR